MTLSSKPDSPKIVSSDDLLRNAIPIDALEEDDDDESLEILEPIIKETTPAAPPPKPKLQKQMPSSIPKPTVKPGQKVYVKTFITKLKQDLGDASIHGSPDSIVHLDALINDYLNDHPDQKLLRVTQTIGVLTSKKGDEPTMFVSLWF